MVADLGYSDSTAWWFWQPRPDGYAVIDYFEAAGKDLKIYLNKHMDRAYDNQVIWLPHDAKAKTLQTGRSTVEQLLRPHQLLPDRFEKKARLPIRLVPKLAVQHGIDAVRAILPFCHFDQSLILVIATSGRHQDRDHEDPDARGFESVHRSSIA